LEQRFVNAFAEPLSVTYTLPLPADGAVAGFSFVLDAERTVGRIEKRADAREQFELAVAEGKSAALLEQERTSVFHQEIGNIPPGKELVVEVLVDQPLAWLMEGDWEWRWPQVVAPRYNAPRLDGVASSADAGRVDVEVFDGTLPATVELAIGIHDRVREGAAPCSPSHALSIANAGEAWRVSLSDEARDTLDRDLVVRWPVAAAEPGVTLDVARRTLETSEPDRVFGLLTIVPPRPEARFAATARDLIVLIDTSGSMSGEPLEQAKSVVSGLVRGLGPNDSLELIEFSNRVSRFEAKPVQMTEANRARALAWSEQLRAGGGTEMRTGIAAALAGVRAEAQRQILVITDGQIGFEADVIANVLRTLPASSRLHTLGVGSCVNRSLTGPVARAGRGAEHILGLGEDVEPVLKRILARLEAPLVTNLSISGAAFRGAGREGLPDLHAGAPALVPLELGDEPGTLVVRGQTAAGEWRMEIDVPRAREASEAPAAATLFARERVEDLEMRRAAGEPGGALDREIEALGLGFRIATRKTSWVAVSERANVDPAEPLRRVNQPQGLPHGLSAEGLGLRPAAGMPPGPVAGPMRLMMAGGAARSRMAPFAPSSPAPTAPPPPPRAPARAASPWERLKGWLGGGADEEPPVAGVMEELEREITLEGRVLMTKPEYIVIVVTLGEPLEWERPDHVFVELDDGTRVELQVDPARTTGSASITAGQSLRLWLDLDAPLPGVPVAIHCGEERAVHIALAR
jgi:Ca-activated chloride channel family protein